MSIHTCHAMHCEIPVPPEKLMCKRHWFMVPEGIRNQVWHHYRQEQCDDKNPSQEWIKAARNAIYHVANQEGYL